MLFRRLAAAAGLIAALGLTGPAAQAANAGFTPSQNAAIEKLVHDYLLNHPEVLVQALQKAQADADAQQTTDAKSAIEANKTQLINDPASPVLGNPAGDVTLVEFFDYRCPYCKAVAPTLEGLIKADPKLRVVMKEFPILGPGSLFAARVALVAAKHGKYADFHAAMYQLKGAFNDDTTLSVAEAVGLDPAMVKKEMAAPEIDAQLKSNIDLAKAIGVDGTPAFIAGDTLVPGAVDLDGLKQLIASARAKS
jgi:protein-disulfide isomerase